MESLWISLRAQTSPWALARTSMLDLRPEESGPMPIIGVRVIGLRFTLFLAALPQRGRETRGKERYRRAEFETFGSKALVRQRVGGSIAAWDSLRCVHSRRIA